MGTTRYGTRLSAKRSTIAQITTNTSSIDSVGVTDVNQSSHGLAVLNAIRHNGTIWVKALADAEANVATHVVIELGPGGTATSDNFSYASTGTFTFTSHGASLAQRYLSSSSAGNFETVAPSLAQPLVRPVDANTIVINVQRATSSSSVDNESFRADQVYMRMVNKSGGTLAKGIIVVNDGSTATGVVAAVNSTSKRFMGVVVTAADDDAAVDICYSGLCEILIASGEAVSINSYVQAGPSGKGDMASGAASKVFALTLEGPGSLGADDLVKCVITQAELI